MRALPVLLKLMIVSQLTAVVGVRVASIGKKSKPASVSIFACADPQRPPPVRLMAVVLRPS